MKNKTKIWLIIAASLVLTGCLLFAGVMTTLNWDFEKLSTVKYETNQHEINENFSNISVETGTADIIFVLSDDENCKVECYEEEKTKHSVAIQEDTLVIKSINQKAWYDYIGINFGSPKITVYLPKTEYTALSINGNTGNAELPKDFKFESIDILLSTGSAYFSASVSGLTKIKTSTGGICVKNTSVGAIDLSVSTGEITVSSLTCKGNATVNVSTGKANITNVTCKNFTSNGDTGSITLNHVIATEKLSVERDTGDVKFNRSDAEEIFVKTGTGDVTGSLLTDKVFIAQTDTGDVDVPKTISGGRCEITTDTGDVLISVK
jgi:DUF4097 and DUF4098 domain-containing protein YvlB